MADQPAKTQGKVNSQTLAIFGVGVTLLLASLGQAAWLDGKIEGQGDRLDAKIEALDLKLSAEIKALDAKLSGEIKALGEKISDIDKRLYVVESHVLRVPAVAQTDTPAPAP